MKKSREEIFFDAVRSHPKINDVVRLHADDAIAFIRGMDTINHHTYKSGGAIANNLLAAKPATMVEFIIDHNGIAMYLTATEGAITALVTTDPYKIRDLITRMPEDTARGTALEAIDSIIDKWKPLA